LYEKQEIGAYIINILTDFSCNRVDISVHMAIHFIVQARRRHLHNILAKVSYVGPLQIHIYHGK